MKHSLLKTQMMQAPLSQQGQMRPHGSRGKKTLLITLGLTSLVDAFSILVIYLLLNSSTNSETLNIAKGLQLPVAQHGTALEVAPVIRVDRGQYFLNNERLSLTELSKYIEQLEEVKKDKILGVRPKIIIQADRRSNFATLSPIITQLSEVGFFQIRFAVVDGGRGL